MQDKETVKSSDAIKEIAGILAAGIIRMKEKGLLGGRRSKNENINTRKAVC